MAVPEVEEKAPRNRRKIRLFLVDADPVQLARTREALTYVDDIEIVGEASRGDEVLARIEADATDVVLMDVLLGEPNGFEVGRALKAGYPSLGVLLLSATGRQHLSSSIDTVDGLISKTAPIAEIAQAIRKVRNGRPAVDRTLWPALFDEELL